MNITLIGMPGAGKSYVGERLAQRLGWELVDLDRVMERVHGRPLQHILDTLGERAFLDAQEADAIAHTNDDRLVISPGGSIIYTPRAMEHLQEISHLVYLEAELETILKRIASVPRGIVGLGEKPFDELYAERTQLYRKWASHSIRAEAPPDSIVEEIVARILD